MILVYVRNGKVYFEHADEYKEGELTEADYQKARERKPKKENKTAIVKGDGEFHTVHFDTEAEAKRARRIERKRRTMESIKRASGRYDGYFDKRKTKA